MIRFSLLDPTGNITALVESPVEPERQTALADKLMRRFPRVEQVGFLRAIPDTGEGGVLGELRMAGGEFCGNASMCAAALLCLRGGEEPGTMKLKVSGAEDPVELRLRRISENAFETGIRMPPVLDISERDFSFGGRCGGLTVVRMQGISHLVIEPDSVFFSLLRDADAAARAVRAWAGLLGADGLGLMFLEPGERMRLTPLVYIPGGGTLFWENSCASGSAAVAAALAARAGRAVELALSEPGGTLCASCDPERGEVRLQGCVRLIESGTLESEKLAIEKNSESC